jgi:hypothetical protein
VTLWQLRRKETEWRVWAVPMPFVTTARVGAHAVRHQDMRPN